MKRLTLILVALLIGTAAHAVEWKTMNQATVDWDAVTALISGAPVPENNSIKYRVYLDKGDKANPQVLGDTDQLQYTITLNEEGRFIVGVSAVRFDENGTEIGESEINWSDVNGGGTPNPFGFVHYLKPASPGGLR